MSIDPQAKLGGPSQEELKQLVEFFRAGRHAELERRARSLLERHPASGTLWNLLGAALGVQGKDALPALQKAAELLPNDAAAHNNLGNALKGVGQYEAAAASFRRALLIRPDFAEAHNNLGNALKALERSEEALECYRQALKLRPGFAEAHANLGMALNDLGEHDLARHQFETALALNPGLCDAHHGLAICLLARGMYGRGWWEYEWHWQGATGRTYVDDPLLPGHILPRPSSYLPVSFAGRRFFLLGEQGIGDELFFLRFAPEIRQRGGWVAYAASPKLLPLLARSAELDCVVASGDSVAAADYTFLATEAPLVLGMQDDDPLPPPLPLAPLPERLAQMRERLSALGPGPCLGVTWWAGTPPDAVAGKRKGSYRAVPLAQLAAALKTWPGPVLVLQRNPKPDEITEFASALGRDVHDFSAANDDLEEMLALLALLDEYVGVDNTNMYLGASLGKPCRALLTSLPDWRWGADGENTPWFPGFSQYRQGADGQWGQALAKLAQDLSRSDR